VHITCWNFLPFLLRRVGEAPTWVVYSTLAVWCAGLAALAATLIRIRLVARQSRRGLLRDDKLTRVARDSLNS